MADNWDFEEEETSDGIMFSVYNQDGTRITQPYLSEQSCHLIAAAPRMLGALKGLLAAIEFSGWKIEDRRWTDPLLAAENIIAVATDYATRDSGQ